jgi:DNA-binding PadR family transcriptional regulator
MDVRTICLGILTLGDATGYEIRKVFSDGAIGEVYDANFGSIYPALNRLTDEGLVVCTAHAQEGRPDKKVYSITAAGRTVFAAALMRAPAPDRFRSEFVVTLLFAHLLPRAKVRQLLDDRIAHHRAEIDRLDAISREGSDDFVNSPFMVGFGLAHHRAALTYLVENRHLLEGAETPLADVAE